jgi:alpha-glucosidase
MALPGGVYVYQGDELGLPDVEDIPDDRLQDPFWIRSGGTNRGRDGARVPLPWTPDGAAAGFSPAGSSAEPWLPQPAGWGRHAASLQRDDPGSMLALYRSGLAGRAAEPALGDGPLRWLDAGEGVLAFARDRPGGPGLLCVLNLTGTPVELPAHGGVLLASAPLATDRLPPDTAVWLRLAG